MRKSFNTQTFFFFVSLLNKKTTTFVWHHLLYEAEHEGHVWVCVVKTKEKEEGWDCSLGAHLMVNLYINSGAVPCLLEGEQGQRGSGGLQWQGVGCVCVNRVDEPREALWKCHCHFDSWTVLKRDAAGHFPLCVGTMSHGGCGGSWD